MPADREIPADREMPGVAEMRVVAKVALLSVGIWWVLGGDAMSQGPEQGGRFNLELPTLGGKQFWADVRHFHKWRIQLNVVTGHYRLLDSNNIRHAWGTLGECSRALESIRKSRSIPSMQGKAVVLLHGLMRSRSSMQGLSDYLEKKGGFEVFNVSYPTTRNEVGQHAKRLSGILNQLDGIEEINFVAHSLGNLVIRHYLGDAKKSETGPDPRITRISCLVRPTKVRRLPSDLGVISFSAGSRGVLGINWHTTGKIFGATWLPRRLNLESSPEDAANQVGTTPCCLEMMIW